MRANPFWDRTVGPMLDAAALHHPEREAIVFREERIAYRELHRQAEPLTRSRSRSFESRHSRSWGSRNNR
ncbi:MAG: hypothetical protein ACE5JD_04020 [Candidatus Methylomirabilia bacterium]